jgi:hypothetical protein
MRSMREVHVPASPCGGTLWSTSSQCVALCVFLLVSELILLRTLAVSDTGDGGRCSMTVLFLLIISN